MMSSRKKQQGFTLTEIMVATVIFAIVAVALLGLFNYVLKINRRSEALKQASQGMRNFVEFLVKEIRNGQIDYGVVDPGGIQTSSVYPIGPCAVSANAVSSTTPVSTYSSQENKLGLVNTDNVEECVYYGKADGSYVDTVGGSASTFSAPAGQTYTLVLQKPGLSAQILNPPNLRVDKMMFLIRPTKDPYVSGGGFAKVQPFVVIILKFVVKLPTGETVPIYYQTSVSSNKYDIPNQ